MPTPQTSIYKKEILKTRYENGQTDPAILKEVAEISLCLGSAGYTRIVTSLKAPTRTLEKLSFYKEGLLHDRRVEVDFGEPITGFEDIYVFVTTNSWLPGALSRATGVEDRGLLRVLQNLGYTPHQLNSA